MHDYVHIFRESLSNPEKFWSEDADTLNWIKKYEKVLDPSHEPFYKWFPGGILNTCFHTLDAHIISGRGDQAALIYDSPVTMTTRTYSYHDLLDEVQRCAGGLQELGVGKGDRVIIYMPMIPEAVIGMLACARIGAIHSVVFGGFAAKELASRIKDAQPRAILTASCGIEVNRIISYKPLLDEAIRLSGTSPDYSVIVQRQEHEAPLTEERDIEWSRIRSGKPAACVPVASTDPLYILYTSGTTGIPKGVVRDNGGHLVALKWSMKNMYGARPGDVYWAASDIGWVVGHSYIVYGPLMYGCTTVLYEGKSVGTPNPGAFWRLIEEHRVNILFTAPTAFRAIRREDPGGSYIREYDISSLRTLFLAGERCDPDTLRWAEEKLKVPVIDHWWQTETGWAIAGNPVGIEQFPVRAGSCTKPLPGYDVRIVDEKGVEVPSGTTGNIVIRLPLPPGCLTSLWQKDREYVATYLTTFPGFYLTGDAGFFDSDGYLWVMGRTDDIINTAGHRLSTGAMEEVLASHPDVAECAVAGVADEVKGEIPLGFVVLKSGVTRDHKKIASELIGMVRERIGPIASFKNVVIINRLPKTRSGKILRSTMKKIADGETYTVPATIDDPAVLAELGGRLREAGFPRA